VAGGFLGGAEQLVLAQVLLVVLVDRRRLRVLVDQAEGLVDQAAQGRSGVVGARDDVSEAAAMATM
jgi:hypothetical protein